MISDLNRLSAREPFPSIGFQIINEVSLTDDSPTSAPGQGFLPGRRPLGANTNPIWAISAMIPALEPHMKQAVTNFRGRIFNALLGCATGLLFLLVGGSSEWKLPFALSATVLLSSYVVRIPAMWRQAPITAAIIIAAGLTHHSKLSGVEIGLRRVGEVMLGCVMGLLVTWLMSKIWPLPEAGNKEGAAAKPSSP